MDNLEEISTVRGMIDNNNSFSSWSSIPGGISTRTQEEVPIEELLHTLEREREILEDVLDESKNDEDEDEESIIKDIKISEVKRFLQKYKNIKNIIDQKTSKLNKIELDMKKLEDLIKNYDNIINKLNTNFLLDPEIKETETKFTILLKEKLLKIKIKNNNEIIKSREKINLYQTVLNNLREIIKESSEVDENFVCKICYTNEFTHVIIPCGHLICVECKNRLEGNNNEIPISIINSSISSMFGNLISFGDEESPPSTIPELMPRNYSRRRVRSSLNINGNINGNKCHICRSEYTNMVKIFKI